MHVGSVVTGMFLAFVAGSVMVVGPPAITAPSDPFDALARFGEAMHRLAE